MDIRYLATAQASNAMVVFALSYAYIKNVGIWVDPNHAQFQAKFLEFYDLELDALLEWTERLVDATKQAISGGSRRLKCMLKCVFCVLFVTSILRNLFEAY